DADPEDFAKLIKYTKLPVIRQYIARRVASLGKTPTKAPKPGLSFLLRLLRTIEEPVVQEDVLLGILEAFAGQREYPMPDGWADVYQRLARSTSGDVRDKALLVGAL